MVVVAGGCAELRAVCRPVEVRGVAAVMADAELAHSEAVEHGHACRACWERGSRGGPAWWRRGCGGAAWLDGVEEKPFVRRVRQLERPCCLRQDAACA